MKDKEQNTSQNDTPRKKITSRQIVAMGGIILLVLMYLITLIVAIVDTSSSGRYFALCLACTFVIPIIVWFYSWMYGRATGKKVIGDSDIEDSDIGASDEETLQ